jgi:hypothetical protein
MPDVALMKAFVDDAFEELKRRCAAKAEPSRERDAGLESASALGRERGEGRGGKKREDSETETSRRFQASRLVYTKMKMRRFAPVRTLG